VRSAIFVPFAVAAAVMVSTAAGAAPKSETVAYTHGKVALEGYLAYDQALQEKRPAVMVVHDWMGVSDHTRAAVDRLAAAGYVAFAADMYGKGIRPKSAEEAGKEATKYKGDRKLMRARAQAALDFLKKSPHVDGSKIVVMGYCFGGTVALELGRSGAPLAGVVSFHGGLETPTPADAKNIKGRVLVLHGADDPFVPAADVAAFQKEMRDAGLDWQFVAYGGAVHAFSNPAAGNDQSKGAAYNEKADKRSWQAFLTFLKDLLA
jgi:dienelactone hydrolase